MQLLIMSILGYLILFNSSLTFRLKIQHNVVITGILLIHMMFLEKYIGNLFVIPMFLCIGLYVYYLKKEDWTWNLFLLIVSYIFLVIVDNVTHFVWSIAELSINESWIGYILIDYPVFFFICRFLSRITIRVKNKKFLPLSKGIQIALGIELILCMLIIVLHIVISELAGASPEVLLSSVLLYTAYIIVTILTLCMIFCEYEKNAKIMLKQNSYDNLQTYMTEIEGLYENLRGFRHDYINIMASMSGYIEAKDMEGLKKYYEKEIFPISHLLNKEEYEIAKLRNLDIVELKSLISVKLNFALELKIEVHLEITEKINAINMKMVDLIRIIGILLDNAVEACQECEKPSIILSMIKMSRNVTIIVKNTYIEKNIDYSKLGSLGTSSKGEQRGIGLYNIRNIISNYENVTLDTEYNGQYFTQLLEIYGEDQEAGKGQ